MSAVAEKNALIQVLRIGIGLLVLVLIVEVMVFVVSLGWGGAEDSGLDFGGEPARIEPMPPAGVYEEAITRSLFSWNRQPVVTNQQPVDEAGISSRWVLSGVVNTGKAIYAIFSAIEGEQRLRLEEGMYLENWKIASITPERVALANDGMEEVFHLRVTEPVSEIKVPPRARAEQVASPEDEGDE